MNICPKCGTNFNSAFCPNCGTQAPIQNYSSTVPQNPYAAPPKPIKNSGLSITALIFSILGCTLWIGLILAVIDLAGAKKHPETKHGLSIGALGVCAAWFVLSFAAGIISGVSSYSDEDAIAITESSESMESEVISETTSEQEETVPRETKEEFVSECTEFVYKDFARNPDEHIGEKIKVDVKVFEVNSGGMFTDYDYYYKVFTDDGNGYYMDKMIWIFDKQDKNSESYIKILEDDIITVYGTFTGMVETKNNLSGSKGEEIGIELVYVDLIEE